MASSEAATTAASWALWRSSRVTECRAALGLKGSDLLDIEPIGSRTVERIPTGILPGLTGISHLPGCAIPSVKQLMYLGGWTRLAADRLGKLSHGAGSLTASRRVSQSFS
jgi:hypothetical protein